MHRNWDVNAWLTMGIVVMENALRWVILIFMFLMVGVTMILMKSSFDGYMAGESKADYNALRNVADN